MQHLKVEADLLNEIQSLLPDKCESVSYIARVPRLKPVLNILVGPCQQSHLRYQLLVLRSTKECLLVCEIVPLLRVIDPILDGG